MNAQTWGNSPEQLQSYMAALSRPPSTSASHAISSCSTPGTAARRRRHTLQCRAMWCACPLHVVCRLGARLVTHVRWVMWPAPTREPCSCGSRAVCSRSQPSHPSIKMAAGAAVGGRAALPLQPPIVGHNRRRVFEYLSKVFITHDSVAPSLFIFMIERRPLYSYS